MAQLKKIDNFLALFIVLTLSAFLVPHFSWLMNIHEKKMNFENLREPLIVQIILFLIITYYPVYRFYYTYKFKRIYRFILMILAYFYSCALFFWVARIGIFSNENHLLSLIIKLMCAHLVFLFIFEIPIRRSSS